MVDDRNRAIRDYAVLAPYVINPWIVRPKMQAINFMLKQVMFQMLQIVIQLNRLPSKDPHFHLKCFLEASDAFMITGASKEALGLTLFPFYLRDQVKALLNSLLSDSIIIWTIWLKLF